MAKRCTAMPYIKSNMNIIGNEASISGMMCVKKELLNEILAQSGMVEKPVAKRVIELVNQINGDTVIVDLNMTIKVTGE